MAKLRYHPSMTFVNNLWRACQSLKLKVTKKKRRWQSMPKSTTTKRWAWRTQVSWRRLQERSDSYWVRKERGTTLLPRQARRAKTPTNLILQKSELVRVRLWIWRLQWQPSNSVSMKPSLSLSLGIFQTDLQFSALSHVAAIWKTTWLS